MTMMKRLYICILLLTMVSTAVIAQDVQQKDDAKKEAKAAKPKKEKKVKEPKAKKEKAPKAEKASSKGKANTTVSTNTSKKLKKDTPEYEASIKASTEAMKTMLSDSAFRLKALPDDIMKFTDNVCAKFGNDPKFMCKIADLFLESYGNEIYCQQRYDQIKKMYPEYQEAYMSEGNLFFQLAWREYPTYDIVFLEKARQQIDSAKVKYPNSTEPYMRWAYWQTPYRHVQAMSTGGYKHLGVDSELEALNKAFPNYQGHLRIAKYINHELLAKKDLSKDDKDNYIIDAVDFYSKANRDSMSRIDIVDYAELCGKYNDQSVMEHALELLSYGISREPDYPYYYRYKLWTEAALAKKFREQKLKNKEQEYYILAMETGKKFFEDFDSIQKFPNDYYFMANACMETKNFNEALRYYNDEFNSVKDTLVKIDALFNIMLCHYNAAEHDKTIEAFDEYEKYKRNAGKEITYYDYQYLIKPLLTHAKDTVRTNQERIKYYNMADSIFALAAEATPEYYYDISETRLTQILFNKMRLEFGTFGYDQAKLPYLLEAANRLIVPLEKKLSEESTLSDKQYFQLMEGYHWALVHYMANDDGEHQYFLTEKMLSIDMPSEMELVSLSKGYKDAYKEYVDQAQELNIGLRPKYGRKRGK